MATHYEILGVHERADTGAIRSAYLERIGSAHPDRGRLGGGSFCAFSAAEINVAYGVLRDRVNRAQYDRHLAQKRYSAIGLQRIEPVTLGALLTATVARLLLINYLVKTIRGLVARARLVRRTMVIPTLRRPVRPPRAAPARRAASSPSRIERA